MEIFIYIFKKSRSTAGALALIKRRGNYSNHQVHTDVFVNSRVSPDNERTGGAIAVINDLLAFDGGHCCCLARRNFRLFSTKFSAMADECDLFGSHRIFLSNWLENLNLSKISKFKFGAANKVVKWTTTTRSMSVRHLANLSRRISCFVTSGSFITIFIRPRGKWAKHWAVSGARWAECEAVDALRIFGLQIFGWDGVSADLSPCHLSKTSTGQHSSFHFLHWSVDSGKLTEIFRSLADD